MGKGMTTGVTSRQRRPLSGERGLAETASRARVNISKVYFDVYIASMIENIDVHAHCAYKLQLLS